MGIERYILEIKQKIREKFNPMPDWQLLVCLEKNYVRILEGKLKDRVVGLVSYEGVTYMLDPQNEMVVLGIVEPNISSVPVEVSAPRLSIKIDNPTNREIKRYTRTIDGEEMWCQLAESNEVIASGKF